jgi:pyridoxal phosphate-dependent aminotransferase EpsN
LLEIRGPNSGRIFLSPPDLGDEERELVLDALDSNWIAPVGPHVDAFEEEMCHLTKSEFGIAVTSGSAALHLCLRLCGVGPGDKVLAPTLTFIASVAPVRYLGAEVKFIDADPQTWNIDVNLLEAELIENARTSSLPKALITVDLYGQCADYDNILRICEHYGVVVIEDAAEALGSSWQGKPAGSFGALRAMSFNGNKIVTTSGGGMVFTDDPKAAAWARLLANQAREAVNHFEHRELGYNYGLSNLLAALGRAQIRTLAHRVEKRRRIWTRYAETIGGVPGILFAAEDTRSVSNRWLSTCTIDPITTGVTRDQIVAVLASQDIEARPVWKPMHLQPVFANTAARLNGSSEKAFTTGLCLPSGSSLTDHDQDRIIELLLSTLTSKVSCG